MAPSLVFKRKIIKEKEMGALPPPPSPSPSTPTPHTPTLPKKHLLNVVNDSSGKLETVKVR